MTHFLKNSPGNQGFRLGHLHHLETGRADPAEEGRAAAAASEQRARPAQVSPGRAQARKVSPCTSYFS